MCACACVCVRACMCVCVCVQGVVERLQMTDPSSSLVHCQLGRNAGLFTKSHAVEMSNLTYLAHCYARTCEESGESKVSCCGMGYMQRELP